MARILVVEDNPDSLELMRFLLARAGHEVLTAYDGFVGLTKAEEEHPDLILLDMGMPDMDGWTTARKLKENPSTGNILVVAVTAYALAGDRKRALAAGCDGYIAKPFQANTFAEEVEKYIPPALEGDRQL